VYWKITVHMHALEGFMDGVQVYLGSFCDIPEAVILGKLPLAQVLPESGPVLAVSVPTVICFESLTRGKAAHFVCHPDQFYRS